MRADSNNLNVLRAIAVMLVFVSHAIQYLTSAQKFAVNLGHAGVLLFFVHTSLVLMLSLERQGEGSRWSRFMIRRAFRIYPLAVIAVVIYVWLTIPSISAHDSFSTAHSSWASIVANLALVQNLFNFESVPGVLWSLPCEIQMYIVLPIVFLVIRKRSTVDLVSIWILSLAVSLIAMALAPGNLAGLFQYVPCFVAGAIAYALPRKESLPAWMFPLIVISVAALFVPANPRMVIIQWPLCFTLGYSIPRFRELGASHLTDAAASIAKYSFGIYLFHEAFLVLFLPRLGWFGIVPAFSLTLAVSIVAFRVVESPFIKFGKTLSNNYERKTKLAAPPNPEAVVTVMERAISAVP